MSSDKSICDNRCNWANWTSSRVSKEWHLHTFLQRFSAKSEQEQINTLLSESNCSRNGHPKKARGLIQKWLRYKRRRGIGVNVQLSREMEQMLWRVVKGCRDNYKSDDDGEEVQGTGALRIRLPQPPPAYVSKLTGSPNCDDYTAEFDPAVDFFEFVVNTATVTNCDTRPKKRSLTLGDIIDGDPTELKRRRIGSPAPSRILTRQFEVQRLEEAIKKLERERQRKQYLVDRYNTLSIIRDQCTPEENEMSNGAHQFPHREQFVGDIKNDSDLYLSNYRQDLDLFFYLYGIDSTRVSSLLDHTVEIFNAYATNIEIRSQVEGTFKRLVRYLTVNNFSRECQQQHQREFGDLRERFFEELRRHGCT